MRRFSPLAILPLLLLAGGVSFANPYINDQPDLNQVWLELPPAHVALEGDLHIRIVGEVAPGLRLRIAREDDDDRTLLATMPISLDSEKRMSLPCGYFPRGGIYYLEIIADINDNFLSDDYDNVNKSFISKREVADYNSDLAQNNTVNNNDRGVNASENSKTNARTVNKTDINKRDKNKFAFNKKISKSNQSNTKESIKVIKRQVINSDQNKATITETSDSIVKSWKFEVLWPKAKLDVTPEQIQTYPERQVTTIIEFSKVVCTPLEATADFWLELLYCGHSNGGAVLCDGKNSSSHAHVVYSEQMHGFPGRRTMTLRCELFGQAGDYALTLRPAAAAGPQDLATAFIKADWSEQFVLNVHGGSVFPCGEGVRVLFQYPECVLEGADRVRVFGREGEKLQYVAERRVKRGQHTASFDCRLFTERFPEYCFVYVSQAVTGAVADVRMDCLPTLPVSEGGAGGWGEWSPWTACPAPDRCTTRTRSRHRFCDSPPPAYGAKYCEGPAVELAACECSAEPWAGDSSVVVAEVGARCRCGCVLHLAPAARLLAGSARACPARSFWLLQAEEGLSVKLRFEAVRLPCAGQTLKARDGDSLGSPLLASWEGPDAVAMTGDQATNTDSTGIVEISGGRHILVELRSTDTTEQCAGGFLAHASQVESAPRNVSAAWASISGAAGWWREGGSAKVAALALAAAAALAAIALAIHSAQRNRAYQRAADKESLTDSDACSASLELGGATTGSRSTLLSEVAGAGVSLRRLLPSGRTKHTRLRESDRISANVEPRDTENDGNSDSEAEVEGADAASVTSRGSKLSEATVTPEGISSSSAPAGNVQATPSPLRRSHTMSTAPVSEQMTSSLQQSIQSETITVEVETYTSSISSVSEREGDSYSEKDRDSAWEKDRCESRASSSTSAATLTNGWYSPALSGVSAARIKGNPKYKKENSNRRLLKSDLSLSSHPEMEIDYYDYEVNNAGSVPGSYLGMDPAFLVWIPPIEDGDIIKDIDESKSPVYEEILPKELRPDPGSNTESPEDRPSSNALRKNKQTDNKTMKKVVDRNIIHPLNFSITDLQNSPKMNKKFKKKKGEQVSIALKDLSLNRSPVPYLRKERLEIDSSTLKRVNDTARETKDSDSEMDISELKYADDSESSNDIRFADDETPDSNRLVDRFDVKV